MGERHHEKATGESSLTGKGAEKGEHVKSETLSREAPSLQQNGKDHTAMMRDQINKNNETIAKHFGPAPIIQDASKIIWDTQRHEVVGNNVYDVSKTPNVGSTAKFENYTPEYIGTGTGQ